MTVNRLLLPLALFALLPLPALAEVTRMTLHQQADIQTQHQRLVGNVRAQARREGVVVNTPQLYVFLADQAAAFHQDGYRPGFERELNLIVNRERRARSMVRLDRLMERVETPEGERITASDLPATDVFLLLYRKPNCAECDQVAAVLDTWAESNPDRAVLWIDVKLKPR